MAQTMVATPLPQVQLLISPCLKMECHAVTQEAPGVKKVWFQNLGILLNEVCIFPFLFNLEENVVILKSLFTIYPWKMRRVDLKERYTEAVV